MLIKNNLPPLILLAGGKSSRMNSPKGLLPIGEVPLLIHQLNVYEKSGGKNVVIVLGPHASVYRKAILDHRPNLNIECIVNHRVELGAISSIQCGIKEALRWGPLEKVFIQPVDSFILSNCYSTLSRNTEGFDVITPEVEGRGAHPILILEKVIKEIEEIDCMDQDARLDFIIKKYYRKRIKISCPELLLNLNTPEDYKKAQSLIDKLHGSH